MYEILRKLGLTKYEALAYLELLKHNKITAFDLSKQSTVPFGRIYDTLSQLENKGFIETVPEKPKKYYARNAEKAIEEYIETTKNNMDLLQKQASKEIKKLEVRQETPENIISVTQGEAMMSKQAAELISNTEKEIKAITYNFEASNIYPTLRRYIQKLREKNGKIQIIAPPTKKNLARIKEIKKENTLIKTCDIDNIHLWISDKKDVLIGIYDPKNYPFKELNVHIRNATFGKMMDKLYDSLWEKL